MNGKVVGINTAIIAGGQGIGFAIPINLALDLLPQLKAGKVVRSWIGVAIQTVAPELARAFELEETDGVLVSDVAEDSPASESGLQRGDVILRFDGQEVENAHDLSRMVASKEPENKVQIMVARGGEKIDLKLQIGTMEDEQPVPEKSSSSEKMGTQRTTLDTPVGPATGLRQN